MQTIEEKAREIYLLYKEKDRVLSEGVLIGFMKGVEFAQRWISVDEELPPCSYEDILIKGIDSDGRENMPDIGYMHSSSNNIPNKENFSSLSGEIMEVTHWRPIELK